jgi:hypothetical protein
VSRVEEWLALGAVFVSRLVNTPPVVVANPDVAYALQSVVFATWAILALVVLAWSRGASDAVARQREHHRLLA